MNHATTLRIYGPADVNSAPNSHNPSRSLTVKIYSPGQAPSRTVSQVRLPALAPFSPATSDSADKSFPEIPFNSYWPTDFDYGRRKMSLAYRALSCRPAIKVVLRNSLNTGAHHLLLPAVALLILSAAAPRTTKALEPEATLAANSQTSNASETRPPSSSAEQSIPLPQIADRAKELHSRDQISQMRGIQSVVDRVQQELNAIQTTEQCSGTAESGLNAAEPNFTTRPTDYRGFDQAQSRPEATAGAYLRQHC